MGRVPGPSRRRSRAWVSAAAVLALLAGTLGVAQSPAQAAPGQATLGDLVWNDLNRNGIQDPGEPGIPGVRVTIVDATNTPVWAGTTGTDGTWSALVNPATGGYTITFALPSGTSVSPALQGGDPAVDSNAVQSGGATEILTGPVVADTTDLTLDVGAYSVATPSKSVVPASGTSVTAGDALSWTLTFDNRTGGLDSAVDQTDDLTGVLDDATVNLPTASTPAGLTITPGPGNASFEVAGVVPAGTATTVTFGGAVGPLAGGDHLISNVVAPTASCPGGVCPAPSDCSASATCTVNLVSGFTVSTSVDSTIVAPGGVVTYTVHVVNTGAGAVTASFTDDLSDVVDDAPVVTDTLPSGASLSADGKTLTWTGSVAAGASADVAYQVAAPDPFVGNGTLAGTVTPGPGGACAAAGACATSTPTAAFTVSKAVSSSSAAPGSTVTYTVHVVNTGPRPVTASFTDDLTGVLDDAAVSGPMPGGGSLSGKTLTWSRNLGIGASWDVIYHVTINPTTTGDGALVNKITPGPSGVCVGIGCTVTTQVQGFTVSKTASPAVAVAGGLETYTVTLSNPGTSPINASFTDDLSGVLDDGAIEPGSLSAGASLSGTLLSWAGSVPAAGTTVVTYQVRVGNPPGGDASLVNTLTPDTGGTCVPPGCTTTTPIQAFTIGKSVDVAVAAPGQTLTYTVHVANAGSAGVTASFTDDLSDVADDASLTGTLPAGATYDASTGNLSWSGTLAAGASTDVAYQVRVGTPPAGNKVLVNVATPGAGGACAGTCATTTQTQGFTIAKTADVPMVSPGGTVTYTVHVVNAGSTSVAASFTDDLSGVLDDATLTSALPAGASLTGNTLTWGGTLAPGGSADVTYGVTVDEPMAGDAVLTNTATPGTGGTCASAGGCTTTTPTQAFVVSKTVDASVAAPGQVLTYTVHVANVGSAAMTASFTDDLSGVLDDGALVAGTLTGGATLSGNTLAWSGDLAAGATKDVTYQIVLDDPMTGDATLVNAVIPGTGGTCGASCGTTTTTTAFAITKSASVSVAPAAGLVTYTVHVVNTGSAPVPAAFTDDLSGVLDDASLVGTLPNGASLTGGILSWAGVLPVGASTDVTYTVQVGEPPGGDRTLRNVATPGSAGTCAGTCTTTTLTRAFSVTKTASPTSVTAGDMVTYTVHVASTGSASVDATFADDLSGVLDDASLADALPAGLTLDGTTLRWSGTLAAGASTDLSYRVLVASPIAGDGILANAITPGPGGTCLGGCSTTTPTSAFTISKSADVGVAGPGDVVTYTVHVASTGTTGVAAAFTDDLTDVLDDATLVGTLPAGATLDGEALVWAGQMAAGEQRDVVYRAQLNAPLTPGAVLGNAATPGPGGTCDVSCATVTDTRAFTVSKTADVAVAPQDGVVTYTVHVVSIGTAGVAASFTDDLSGVLDDATFVTSSLPAGASLTGDVLSWTGTLASGNAADVAYQVRVAYRAAASGGADGVLVNVVTPGAAGACVAPGCSTTVTTQGFTVTKHVDVTVAAPGDLVTYTVDVAATGSAPVTASFSDDLSDVLDDATLVTAPLPAGARLSGTLLLWTGDLAAGASATVSYQVRVDGANRGDGILTNLVDPTAPGICGDTCTTTTLTRHLAVTKTSDAPATGVRPGDVVAYTVTATNTGTGPFTAADPATVVDDMSGVLDDATSNGDAAASTGTPTVNGGGLVWTGPLAAHASVTLTYSVRVTGAGDLALTNVACAAGTCPAPPACTAPGCASTMSRVIAAVDDVVRTTANTPVDVAVLANDVGSGLVVTGYAPPQHGTVTQAGGTLTYAPAAGYSGPDTFTYSIADAYGATASGTVSVVVAPVAHDDAAVTANGAPVDVAVLDNDLGTALIVTEFTQPAHGTLTLQGPGTLTYTPVGGFSGPDVFTYTAMDAAGQQASATVRLNTGMLAVDDTATTAAGTPVHGAVLANDLGTGLTAALLGVPAHGAVNILVDGTFTYAPAAGYSGPDVFTYQATDASGQTGTAAVRVTIAPVAVADTATTAANTPLPGTVLGNDIGTGLSVTAWTTPAHGVVSVSPAGAFTYVPQDGYSGPDAFTYTITDASGGTATAVVGLVVTPRALDDQATTVAGTPVSVDVLANDLGTGLTAALGGAPAHGTATLGGGVFTYTPAGGYSGPDAFTYTVTDASGRQASGTVTVGVGPVAVDDAATTAAGSPVQGSVLANDVGSGLSVQGSAQPLHGTVSVTAAGVFTYQPPDGYSGPDSFTYTITDAAGGTAGATVVLMVTPVARDVATTTPPGRAVSIPVLPACTGAGLAVTANSTPAHGTATLGGGVFTYTPASGYTGADSFTYTVTDATGQTASATVHVMVSLPAVDVDVTTSAGTPVSGSVQGLLAPVTSHSGATWGSVTIDAAGAFTYVPVRDFSGLDAFTYTLTDASGQLATGTVRISVIPAVSVIAPAETPAGVPVSGNLLANATGTGLTATVGAQPAHGQVVVYPNGDYTYTPVAGYSGTDSFAFTVTDSAGGTAGGTIYLRVTPLAVGGAFSTPDGVS
ncbi:MAG: Ig-like domain-containing protein, partial [Actinomycetia bacterium]|nr:Ig-like domain-containing protein [Actinomycetes bacterium]